MPADDTVGDDNEADADVSFEESRASAKAKKAKDAKKKGLKRL